MLNFGIISTARINQEALLGPASKRDDVVIRAVASRNLGRARDYAAAKGISVAYGSYEELLDDPTIDAVYISTPNAFHVPWVKQALLKGKHVLCEKPFSPTYREAIELVQLAESRGLLLMEAMHYSHHPTVRQLIQELQDGRLGEIESVYAKLSIPIPPQGDIRYQPGLMGGAFMHIGCYCMHFIQSVVDAPLVISNINIEKLFTDSADILAVGDLKASPEIGKLNFNVSLKDRRLSSFAKIQGSKGSLLVNSLFNPVNTKSKPHIDQITLRSDVLNGFQLPENTFHQSTYDFQLNVFLNAIKKGDVSPLVDSRNAGLIEQGQALLKPFFPSFTERKFLLAS